MTLDPQRRLREAYRQPHEGRGPSQDDPRLAQLSRRLRDLEIDADTLSPFERLVIGHYDSPLSRRARRLAPRSED